MFLKLTSPKRLRIRYAAHLSYAPSPLAPLPKVEGDIPNGEEQARNITHALTQVILTVDDRDGHRIQRIRRRAFQAHH